MILTESSGSPRQCHEDEGTGKNPFEGPFLSFFLNYSFPSYAQITGFF